MAACSSDNNDFANPQEQAQQPTQGVKFTATISTGESAMTRALSESGSDINASWAVNDQVALVYTVGESAYKTDATVTAVNDGKATITATLGAEPIAETAVTLIYPATAANGTTGNVKSGLLTAQDGTLDGIASKYDVRTGTGTLTVNGTTATLKEKVTMTNQYAIWKLTTPAAAKNLCILADNATIAGATLATEGTAFYVAVPAVTSQTITVVANDASNNCYYFSQAGVSLAASKYYQSSPSMTTLGTESSEDVYKITGSSSITIPADKTVVLSGVNISKKYYITCSGNATIILMGTNSVTHKNKPAIQAGGSGTTLTITGTGSLTAQGGGNSAAIGANQAETCGNIVICGGTVTATGGENGAGIGSGANSSTCGNISITGGTVNATGGQRGAGIGSGCYYSSCGTITITSGVTSVTATKGYDAPNSIGEGYTEGVGSSPCGTVTIGGVTGAISTSPYTYTPGN